MVVGRPWPRRLGADAASPREKQLLKRLAAGNGRPNRRALGSDAEQVSQQRTRLLRKLGISTPAEIADAAARWAHQPRYRGIT